MNRNEGRSCRVCGSARIIEIGRVEYLRGFDWPVLDCDECGCRWTQHDDTVHQRLHAAPAISYYAEYVQLSEQARTAFVAGDLQMLSAQLRRWPKYRFVLDSVGREPRSSRILEVGCSRGYLTSHLILDGRNVLGIDVSDEAITAARSAFGDHFAQIDSARAMDGRPYDLIYHVGMIGCVSDPIGLTKQLLSLVRPGGRLIFNAPNRAALHLRGQLWFDSAPPPDLVTLFPEGFWRKYFSREALVEETVEWLPADQSAQIVLLQLLGQTWSAPSPLPMDGRGQVWTHRESAVSRWAGRIARRGVSPIINAFAKRRPTEFGLFVSMTARS